MPKRTEMSGTATASHMQENGFSAQAGSSKKQERGFETFVMTGDMIIHTTSSQSGAKKPPPEKKAKNTKNVTPVSHIPTKKESPRPSRIPHAESPRPSRIPTAASQVKSPLKHKVRGIPRPIRHDGESMLRSTNSTDSEATDSEANPPAQIENLESVNNNLVANNMTEPNTTISQVTPTTELTSETKVPILEAKKTVDIPLTEEPILDETPVYLQKTQQANMNPVFLGMRAGGSPELDIPPDDISSEDYKYIGMDNLVDLDALPPPPDDLLSDNFTEKSVTTKDTERKSNETSPSKVPLEASPSRIPFYSSDCSPSKVPQPEKPQVASPSKIPQFGTPKEGSPSRIPQIGRPNDGSPSRIPHTSSKESSPSKSVQIETSPSRIPQQSGPKEGSPSKVPPSEDSPSRSPQIDPPSKIPQFGGSVESPSYKIPLKEKRSQISAQSNPPMCPPPEPALIATVTPDLQAGFLQDSQCKTEHTQSTQSKPLVSTDEKTQIFKDVSVTSHSESSETTVTSSTSCKKIVVSKSEERIVYRHSKSVSESLPPQSSTGMRASKSEEEHMAYNNGMTPINIDLDDMTTSLDVLLHQNNQSVTSIDKVHSRSLDSSPENKPKRLDLPTFICIDGRGKGRQVLLSDDMSDTIEEELETRMVHGKSEQELAVEEDAREHEDLEALLEAAGGTASESEDNRSRGSIAGSPNKPEPPETLVFLPAPVPSSSEKSQDRSPSKSPSKSPGKSPGQRRGSGGASPRYKPAVKVDISKRMEHPHNPPGPTSPDRETAEGERSCPSSPEATHDSDSDSIIYHQPAKDVDRPSAQRLAKRLYQMEGFKKTDICRHLCKKNDFSRLVGEEYLQYFDFSGETLDGAVRLFLKRLTLTGETQERERVLAHFSHRYMENNPRVFNSEDACHTLVCAMMLLNTDLHGQNVGRRMTLAEFIENLADLNDGENFPKDVLTHIYQSIKAEPIEFELEDNLDELATELGTNQRAQMPDQRFLGHNPFLDIPDPSKTKEYKKGFVMRKCCVDPDGRKTPMGKRGWKMFYAVLRDMVLYLYKDEHAAKKSLHANMSNAIRVHHALAVKANDYTKKEHVFRLQTADWAQYLLQTSDSKECQSWVDTINFVASSLSAPPLPGAVGSQRKFQRPLLPASYTKLSMAEQLTHHEQKVIQLEQELQEHSTYPPEKGAKSRIIADYLEKESFLQYELKRFKTYTFLLQSKMSLYPELEPSLVEVAIGEVDEPPSPNSSSTDHPLAKPDRPGKSLQRSMSDRKNQHVKRRSKFYVDTPLPNFVTVTSI